MIRLTEDKDLNTLLKLSDDAFGKNYHAANYFSIQDNLECSVYVTGSNEIAGFCTLLINDDFVLLDSITVSKHFRGKGIATLLIEEVILNYGHVTIKTYAWEQNGRINLHPILNRLGFKRIEEIKDYWYKESLGSGFVCPECGNPCRCSAYLYELRN